LWIARGAALAAACGFVCLDRVAPLWMTIAYAPFEPLVPLAVLRADAVWLRDRQRATGQRTDTDALLRERPVETASRARTVAWKLPWLEYV
jgi:hypothetical protein